MGPKFSIVPARALFDARLNQEDITLLTVVCMHANTEDGTCFPSLDTLAKIYSPLVGRTKAYDRSSISKKMDTLEACGYVSKIRQKTTKNGSFLSNLWRVHHDGTLPEEHDRRLNSPPIEFNREENQATVEKTPIENQANVSDETAHQDEEESPAPKVNAYASYNAAFGEPIPNPSSPRVLNAVEDLEEFPGAWIDTAFLRTSKKERSTNERWQYYRRLPYALSLLNEWKHAGAILPERTQPPPKPAAPPRAAPRAPASTAPPDADAARQRAIAEWKRARLANSTGIGASGKSP